MGLSAALNSALSGLHYSESGIDLVSRNIANADTPGYSRKLQEPVTRLLGNTVSSVHAGEVSRDVDLFLQAQLRTENGLSGLVDTRAAFLSRLDQLFGTPGAANAFDTVVNEFGSALQELATSPDQFGVRDQVVSRATTLAQQLNTLSGNVQALRREAESNIATSVSEANTLLQEIARLNQQIANVSGTSAGTAEIEDQRDRYIDQLSSLIDVRVSDAGRGTVNVFTNSGNLLVGTQAATLSFDERAGLDASAVYSTDPSERGVGTLVLSGIGGGSVDLFAGNSLGSGEIAAYRDLRDNVLVEAQQQLDEFAHGLALSLSSKQVPGQAVSVGAQNGFDLDVSELAAGNEISFSYTQTPPGTQSQVTFIRVDDPASLPLENGVTANPDDTVIGVDFSGGLAAAAAAIDAALGGSITASSPGAGTIRILDDGAAGTIAISDLSATVVSTSSDDGSLGLQLFVDRIGSAQAYTNSLDGDGQKTGFASRIAVNQDIAADNTSLVVYSTSPQTGIGDPARPLDLIARFSETNFTFHPDSGIGSAASPLNASITSFAQRIVSFQGQAAEAAQRDSEAQTVVRNVLQDRFSQDVAVSIDEEMGRLLTLQNAYAANARVISAVSELLEILRQI